MQSFTGLLRTQGYVKISIIKAHEKQKMYHDRNNIKPLYPGQSVLVTNTKRMNRKGDKMMDIRTSPFTITMVRCLYRSWQKDCSQHKESENLSLPSERWVHKEAPSCNNTNFQESHNHGKLKYLKKPTIHGTFGCVFNIRIQQCNLVSVLFNS